MRNPRSLFAHLYRWRFSLIVLLLCLFIVWFYFPQTEVEQNSPGRPAFSSDTAALRLGPGAWSVTNESDTSKNTVGGELSGGSIKTNDGKLQIDKTLLNTIQYSILHSGEGDRKARAHQLQVYLQEQLPPSAYPEAQKLVENFLAYMDAHDDLLARQNLMNPQTGSVMSASYIERISTWNEQRSRLRQTMFGISTAQTWFGDDERQARQTLAELRAQLQSSSPAANLADANEEPDSNAIREARVHGVGLSAQLRRDTQEWINQLTESFSGIEHEEQDWKLHYSRYLHAVEQLGNMDAEEKNRRMNLLRQQFLVNETERERARALGT